MLPFLALIAEDSKAEYKAKRDELKALSVALRPLVQQEIYSSINEALLDTYRTEEHQEFKTFWDWKKVGKSVKKGEKAFPIWGKPLEGKPKEEQPKEGEEGEEDSSFWPLCYMFSNAQVGER